MPCSCQTQQVLPTSPDGECLPTLDQACAVAKSTTLCTSCASDADCLSQDRSDGTTLPNSWLDSCCNNEGVTLLGRVGNKLSRFTQSGFIQLINGKAKVVEWVPFKVKTLWHRYWQPFVGADPVIGDPLPFNYLTVLDEHGNPHAIQGKPEEDSVFRWDASSKTFVPVSLSAFADEILGDTDDIPDFVALFNTALTN